MIGGVGNTLLTAGVNNDWSNVGGDIGRTLLDNGAATHIGNGLNDLIAGPAGDIVGNLVGAAGNMALTGLAT
jgi:hypothetical protein